MMLRPLGFVLALGVSGCGGHDGSGSHGNLPPAVPMIKPEAWSAALSTTRPTDSNPDPAILEITLTAAVAEVEYLPDRRARVWAYNGSVPGPTIEANVGDKLVVHFKNDLPEPTTIHWHGLRIPNAMDGTPRVQQPVASGATFSYEFTVPDAGTFWYHPHIRTDVQVEKGLYGALVVRDPDEPGIAVAADEVVVLDDVLIDPATGALDESRSARDENLGKEGNLVLVNGVRSNLEIAVRAGERRRWHVVNAATARFFKLGLAGGELTRIGGDGGLLGAPQASAEVLLSPGERADVVVAALAPGALATLQAIPYERAKGAGATEGIDVIRLVAVAAPAATPPPLPGRLREVSVPSASVAERTIRLGEKMEGGKMLFTINDATFPRVPVVRAKLGTVELWTVVNQSEMDHPFHIHGFRFQQEGGQEWKDTINVPLEATLRLLVDFETRDGAAGGWMYHCHILEHEEGGMMAEVELE